MNTNQEALRSLFAVLAKEAARCQELANTAAFWDPVAKQILMGAYNAAYEVYQKAAESVLVLANDDKFNAPSSG